MVTTKSVYATGSATAQTIFDFSTATGNIIEISGTYGEVNTTSNQTITLNGTYINGASQNGLSTSNTTNNKVLDLIPVLDSENVPCMYDKVSGTFLYNQGTGTFLYG